MPICRLFDMTFEEARDLNRERAVPILPVGAVEAHGPHLPLGTDVIIAEAMAYAGAERLAARGLLPLLLPPVVYSPAGFAAGFAGTIAITPASLAGLIVELADALDGQGFQMLAIANAHLDPMHLAALDMAAAAIRAKRSLAVAWPNLTRKPWALRLTDEFRSGACHAGQFETSIVLATRPDLVRDARRRALAVNPVSLSAAIRDGKTSFEEAGGPLAYFGAPAAATEDEGGRSIAVLGEILAEAVASAREDSHVA